MMKRSIFLLLLAIITLSLSGCGLGKGGKWWVGRWTLDREYTQQQMDKAGAAKPPEGLTGLLSGLAGGLALGLLDGTVFDITDKEFRTIRNGAGNAVAYEVIERPSKNSVMIKKSDGEISTLERDGDHLVLNSSGGIGVKVYLKRVK